MFIPRATSPLTYESLPSSPRDDYDALADSEDELDETERAAKRRRIEKLGRDYLEGKELMIFTAGLKGPFDNGWVNPWKKDRSRRKQRNGVTGTRDSAPASKPEAGQQPVSRQPERKSHSGNRRVRRDRSASERPQVPETDPERKRRTNREHRIQDVAPQHPGSSTRRPTTLNPRPTPESLREDTHKTEQKLGTDWLKKDGKGLHHKVVNPTKSPSPTPEYRPRSRQKLGANGSQSGKLRSNNEAEEIRVAAFTPVNGPNPPTHSGERLSALASADDPSKTVPRKQNSSKPSDKGHSSFSKPVAPASATKGQVTKPGPNSARPVPMQPPTSRSGTDEQQFSEGRTATHRRRSQDEQTRTSISANNNRSSARGERANDSRSFASRQNSEPKPSSGSNPGNVGSARTESDNITSAQIVPGKANFPDALLSLASTEGVVHPQGADPHEANDGLLSTQPPLFMSQDSAHDNLASPDNVAPVRPSNQQATAQITPFHTFQSPERRTARGSARGEDRAAIDNRINQTAVPNDSAASKRVQFGTRDRQMIVQGGKDASFGPESPTANRNKAGHPNGIAQEGDSQGGSVAPPHPSVNGSRQQQASGADQRSTGQSSVTVLPFPLSGSTGGTGQQDGQGHVHFNSFDLSQAIADAGSFLQSWDIDREMSLQSRKNEPRPAPAVHPATELKEASQG